MTLKHEKNDMNWFYGGRSIDKQLRTSFEFGLVKFFYLPLPVLVCSTYHHRSVQDDYLDHLVDDFPTDAPSYDCRYPEPKVSFYKLLMIKNKEIKYLSGAIKCENTFWT